VNKFPDGRYKRENAGLIDKENLVSPLSYYAFSSLMRALYSTKS
jgi:hypothetical protein